MLQIIVAFRITSEIRKFRTNMYVRNILGWNRNNLNTIQLKQSVAWKEKTTCNNYVLLYTKVKKKWMKLIIIFSYSSSLFIVKFTLTPLLFLHKIWRHQTIKKATGASLWRMKGSYYYLNQKKLYMSYEKGDWKNLEVRVAAAFLTGQR